MGKITNTFFIPRYIFHIFYSMWVEPSRKKMSLGMFWIFKSTFLIGTPILLFILNINKLSSIKYSIVGSICIHYTVICSLISSSICIDLWPMLNWNLSHFCVMNTRIIMCVVWIKLRCQGYWKWNIPDNEIVPKRIISYCILSIKKKKKIQGAEKKNKSKRKKFTGFENDLILAALAGISVGQWKASHGTIK